MKLPKNVIIMWVGTNASIPSGFTRVTDMDGRYPKGASNGADPNNTGGSLTHSHTSPAHSHTINAHTHTISLNSVTAPGESTGQTSTHDSRTHGHTQVNSGAVNSGGTLSSVQATYDSTNSEPEHYDVIFIQSDGTSGVPENAVVLFDGSTVPDGYAEFSAMDHRFIKGAEAGQDGGTTNGANSHTHTISHSHTETAHTHAQVTSGGATNTTNAETASGTPDSTATHTHPVSLDANTMGYSGTPTSGSVANIPEYSKLLAIQNQSGGQKTPIGIIAMWLGAYADIPRGWEEVTSMNDKHLRIADTVGAIGDTGGTNTHTHSDSHSHTGASHSHTATVGTASNNFNSFNDEGFLVPKSHSHGATVGSSAPNWSTESTTGDSANHEPPYRTVQFIKLKRRASTMVSLLS